MERQEIDFQKLLKTLADLNMVLEKIQTTTIHPSKMFIYQDSMIRRFEISYGSFWR